MNWLRQLWRKLFPRYRLVIRAHGYTGTLTEVYFLQRKSNLLDWVNVCPLPGMTGEEAGAVVQRANSSKWEYI